MKLDRTDLRILQELQTNGRITNTELAERVSLSPSPCLQRVKKLHKQGYIKGYSAEVDIAKLGNFVTIFSEITLKSHNPHDISKFQQEITKLDQVIECHLISSGYDYLVKFVTESISEYQEIMEGLIDRDVGIEKYFSFVSMKTNVVKNYIPLQNLFTIDEEL